MQPEDSFAPQSPDHRRETHATLAAGLFSNGVWDALSIVVPLYAVAVGLSVAEIGLIVAARSVLPTALSIHGGILMDRWGSQRVLLRLALVSTMLPLLYPASGWFSVLMLLQLILGLATSLAMAAAQTWSLQCSRADTATLARFSLVSRIGTFGGPVMVGATWDALGAWAAFICISAWAAGILAAAAYGAPVRAARSGPVPSASKSRALRALIPQWTEHKEAFALAAIPAVAFVLAVSFLRNAPAGIQASFYVVYLADVGFSGTMIGILVGISELFAIAGSLIAAPMERVVHTHRLLIVCIGIAIAAIAVTPMIGHLFALLVAAAAVRGLAQGISQPLMYSLLGRAVPAAMHGATVGLRNSVTRLASIVLPGLMGLVAGAWGIEASFYVIGAMLVLASLALGLVARSAMRNKRWRR
jgi:MFS family permease